MSESVLSGEILFLLRKSFAREDRSRAIEILENYARKYATLKDLYRVQQDMLHVALGDLRELERLSRMDYRDVIMEAEYEIRDGKIVKRDPGLE